MSLLLHQSISAINKTIARIIPPAIAPAIIATDPLVGAVLPDSSPCFGKWPAIVGVSDGRDDIDGGGGILVVGSCQMLPLVVTYGSCVVVVIDGAVVVVVVEYTKRSKVGLK